MIIRSVETGRVLGTINHRDELKTWCLGHGYLPHHKSGKTWYVTK